MQPDTGELIKKYLAVGRTMQLATVSGDQPWICTVYYVEDDQQNLYWLSLPSRRHSHEVARHDKIAIAIQIKTDLPVIGIQAEGSARIVDEPDVIARIMKTYTERHGAGKQFYDNFIAGKNQHILYKCIPREFVLFDETTFAANTRKTWRP